MDHQTELLRAPSRKRKPEHCVTRKPRVVKMTWDVDARGTESLYSELGVSGLPDSDDESFEEKQAPPQSTVVLFPTVESKMTVLPSHPHVQTLGPCGVYLSQLSPPFSHIDPQGLGDASWLVRKPLTPRLNSNTAPRIYRHKMGNQESFVVDPNAIANYNWQAFRPVLGKQNKPNYSLELFRNRLTNQNHTPVRKTKAVKTVASPIKPKHVKRLKFDDENAESIDANINEEFKELGLRYSTRDYESSVFDTPDADDYYCADHWSKLSDEIVLQVFKWLPKTTLIRCLRVCKRWNRLGLDETLWRRMDLTNKSLKSGELGAVLDRGVTVLRLARTDIQAPIYRHVDLNKEQRFSKVQYLDLSMSGASPEALEQIISTCHILRKLSLETCKINNRVCRAIGQNRHLEVLNLSMCEGITENGLVPICNNLQKLDALNIGWTSMSKGAVVYLVICLSPTLTKLNLAGCRETLEDDDIHQLCSSCPNLKELDLSDATMLTGQSVEFIASMLHGLEYIALSRCYHVMPSTLPILQHIATLLALDVFGMLKECAVQQLRDILSNIEVNKFPFSSIARPTTGIRRTSIWGLRVRDSNV